MIKDFIRRRLPRLGKIRLGERVRKGNSEYPGEVPYFVVPPEVAAVYGEQPTELDVMVPSPNIEDWFPVALKAYGSDGRLKCRGDGERAIRFDDETGEWQDITCEYKDCSWYQARRCTEIGNLFVVLPKVSLAGVYQIDTGSWNSINNIYSEFEHFKNIMRAITGRPEAVVAITFRLTREEETLHPYSEQTGRRVATRHYLLHLRAPDLNMQTALQIARRTAALPSAPDATPVLPVGTPELPPPDEQEADMYPGAAPEGPDIGQRAAWAALMEQVKGLGKPVEAVEREACRHVGADVTRFDQLTRDEAAKALKLVSGWVERWQASTVPEAEAAGETTDEPDVAKPFAEAAAQGVFTDEEPVEVDEGQLQF